MLLSGLPDETGSRNAITYGFRQNEVFFPSLSVQDYQFLDPQLFLFVLFLIFEHHLLHLLNLVVYISRQFYCFLVFVFHLVVYIYLFYFNFLLNLVFLYLFFFIYVHLLLISIFYQYKLFITIIYNQHFYTLIPYSLLSDNFIYIISYCISKFGISNKNI